MQLTNGASSSQTETAIQKATAILNHIEGIETYITINGFSVMSGANTSNAATLFVMLKNWDERKAPGLSAQAIVDKFNEMAYFEIPGSPGFCRPSPSHSRFGRKQRFRSNVGRH